MISKPHCPTFVLPTSESSTSKASRGNNAVETDVNVHDREQFDANTYSTAFSLFCKSFKGVNPSNLLSIRMNCACLSRYKICSRVASKQSSGSAEGGPATFEFGVAALE
jgi:hypothetical protein